MSEMITISSKHLPGIYGNEENQLLISKSIVDRILIKSKEMNLITIQKNEDIQKLCTFFEIKAFIIREILKKGDKIEQNTSTS